MKVNDTCNAHENHCPASEILEEVVYIFPFLTSEKDKGRNYNYEEDIYNEKDMFHHLFLNTSPARQLTQSLSTFSNLKICGGSQPPL